MAKRRLRLGEDFDKWILQRPDGTFCEEHTGETEVGVQEHIDWWVSCGGRRAKGTIVRVQLVEVQYG